MEIATVENAKESVISSEESTTPVVNYLRGVFSKKIIARWISTIKSGLEEIGNLEIEDFNFNYHITRNLSSLTSAEKAKAKSNNSIFKKHVEISDNGQAKMESGDFVYKTPQSKEDFEKSMNTLNDSIVEGKLFDLKTSQLKSIKGVTPKMQARCFELITDDCNILKESDAVTIASLGLKPSDLSRVMRGLSSMSDIVIEDYNLNYRIASALHTLNMIERQYQSEGVKLCDKHVVKNYRGVYSSENGALNFKSPENMEAYQEEFENLDTYVMDDKIWTIKLSEIKTIKGVKANYMADCFELIIDDITK
jgi:hypothetical protein